MGDENLRKLLEQHWLHCRHLESERAWFLNVYGIITGGILAYIASTSSAPSPLLYFLIVFLIVLTFIGFFLTLRWTYAFECHREKVNTLATIVWSKSGVISKLDPTMNIPPMDICPKRGNEIFRMRYWFPLFYFIILILLGCAIFFLLDHSPALSKGIAIAAFALACILAVRWCSSLKRIKEKCSPE